MKATFRRSERSTRYFVNHPVNDTPPTGPDCANFECKSWGCRHGHAVRLMWAFGLLPMGDEWTVSYGPDKGKVIPADPLSGRVEVDHKVWNRWKREATATVKADLKAHYDELVAMAEEQGFSSNAVGLGRILFSYKAGCSCGCSPGYITNGYGADVSVDFTEQVPVPDPHDPSTALRELIEQSRVDA